MLGTVQKLTNAKQLYKQEQIISVPITSTPCCLDVAGVLQLNHYYTTEIIY